MGLGCVQTSIDQLISSDIYRAHVQQRHLHDALLYSYPRDSMQRNTTK